MDPFRAPTSIGRYKVTGKLGRGAMGVVFSARDERLGRDIAIKIMNAGLDDEPETRARFFREAQVTSQLLHRNIVTVFDLGEDNNRPYIVMEILKGRTLSQALREPGLETLESKLELMIQLCDGLSKAHSAGVVHRDIKPSNLFVLPDGTLKILDFGVARLASSNMTRTGLIVGTPDYMSPEQARGVEVDERSDIFSAAAVFYLMVTGRKPFSGTEGGVLRRVIREDPEPMTEAEAPAPLASIIMRALNKEVTARFQRCAEVAAELIKFKRSFDAETRQIAAAARKQFDETIRLTNAIRALRQKEDLAADESLEQQAQDLKERLPFFVALADGTAPAVMPMRRAPLAQVNADLTAIVERLGAEFRTLEADAAVRLARIRELEAKAGQALASAEYDRAESLIETAAEAGLDATRLESLKSALADARLVSGSIAAAQAACARGAWDQAIADLEAVAQSRADLITLRREVDRLKAEDARLKEAAARQREAAELAREAERLLGLEDPTGAARMADRALSIAPDQPDATRVKSAALALTERKAHAATLAARAAHHLSRSLQQLGAGQFQNALAEAEAAAQLTPDNDRARNVVDECRRLSAAEESLHGRLKAAHDREREIARLVESARAKLAARERVPALRDAEQALALDPTHDTAKHTLDLVRSVLSLISDDDDDTLTAAAPESEPQPRTPGSLAGFATAVGRTLGAVADAASRLSDKLRGRRN